MITNLTDASRLVRHKEESSGARIPTNRSYREALQIDKVSELNSQGAMKQALVAASERHTRLIYRRLRNTALILHNAVAQLPLLLHQQRKNCLPANTHSTVHITSNNQITQ
ncbi:hypothetical protein D3C81_1692040 [compost metagenome]